MMRILVFSFVNFLFLQSTSTVAQPLFPELCEGHWSGRMRLYKDGAVYDSVLVILDVEKLEEEHSWKWKTDYRSERIPIVKDYVMKVEDVEKGLFILDEKNGIELRHYLFENKLYSLFELGGTVLMASYELRGEELIFEVTSSKKLTYQDQHPEVEVSAFSVPTLQRVVFSRKK